MSVKRLTYLVGCPTKSSFIFHSLVLNKVVHSRLNRISQCVEALFFQNSFYFINEVFIVENWIRFPKFYLTFADHHMIIIEIDHEII